MVTDITNVLRIAEKTFSREAQLAGETNIRVMEYGDRYKATQTRIICFVSHERPINSGDIMGDFQWRREHAEPLSRKDARKYFEELFASFGLEIEKVSYSRKAGCSMCPCSPGYLVTLKDTWYYGKQFAIWS